MKTFTAYITGFHQRGFVFVLSSLLMMVLLVGGRAIASEDTERQNEEAQVESSSTLVSLEVLKKKALSLNREMFILEEDLLYPAETQISVYLSMDVGEFFSLDATELKVNNKSVSSHLYTDRQVKALHRGGIQRLYLGNIENGHHELTAVFTGIGPKNRPYKRATSVSFEKIDDPIMLELVISDSTGKYQPVFTVRNWSE